VLRARRRGRRDGWRRRSHAGECCELQPLCAAPACRQQGIGAALARRFEARAPERGCRTFYLPAFSFQAPSLCKRLGYHAAAEIRGFPAGMVKYLMVRAVASDEG
jgi:GNAT superfamily N-acetyltransferase